MNPATGTFITEDTFGGVLSSPITLNRYAYAGQNPIGNIDPSGHFFMAIKQVITLTLQEMIKDYEGTMAAGRLGAFISVMGAIASGDSDLGWAYVKGYAMGVGTAGLGKLKELGQGIRAAKQLYMVITLVRVFKNGSLAAYSFSKKDYAAAAFYGSLTVFGVLEYRAEAKALYQMNQTSVNNGDIKSHLYYNPDETSYGKSSSNITKLLDNYPELTGTNREKLLSVVQDSKLATYINEVYRPGASIGDGGTADALIYEFYEGNSKHLIKAKGRLNEINKIINSGTLGLNDLDIAEAIRDDLEYAIELFK